MVRNFAIGIWLASVALTAGAVAAPAGVVAKGKAAFAKCAICHKTDASGTSSIGPNLFKVAGRTSGTLKGFSYSPAMVAAKRPWNAAALDAYIAAPSKAIPGNKMPFGGVPDSAERAAIVAYLQTLGK